MSSVCANWPARRKEVKHERAELSSREGDEEEEREEERVETIMGVEDERVDMYAILRVGGSVKKTRCR